MIICSWNIRGLNDPSKIKEVKKIISKYNIKVIAILETKVKANKASNIQKKINARWIWVDNYCCNPRGRIWGCWYNATVDIHISSVTDQFIHCKVNTKD